MRENALVLLCLLGTCHGRRLPAPRQKLDTREELKASLSSPSLQSFVNRDGLKKIAFASLLLASDLRALFVPRSLVTRFPMDGAPLSGSGPVNLPRRIMVQHHRLMMSLKNSSTANLKFETLAPIDLGNSTINADFLRAGACVSLMSSMTHLLLFGPSLGLMNLLAVGTTVLGAWGSVDDLRKSDVKLQLIGSDSHDSNLADRSDSVEVFEERDGLIMILAGSFFLIAFFFFKKYLIYLVLLWFAGSAASSAVVTLKPIIIARRPALQGNKMLDAIAQCVGFGLAGAFLLLRNNVACGWIFQDVLGIMILLNVQREMRLPNLKVGANMLGWLFLFDIFWVFISPFIFKRSVMVDVATGGTAPGKMDRKLMLPFLFKIPSHGGFNILGFGDVAVPGFLISLLLRHDIAKKRSWNSGYFVPGVIGYAIGLIATMVSCIVMKCGQPALLFLVPSTLLPTLWIAWRKKELLSMWRGNYGPGSATMPDNAVV